MTTISPHALASHQIDSDLTVQIISDGVLMTDSSFGVVFINPEQVAAVARIMLEAVSGTCATITLERAELHDMALAMARDLEAEGHTFALGAAHGAEQVAEAIQRRGET